MSKITGYSAITSVQSDDAPSASTACGIGYTAIQGP